MAENLMKSGSSTHSLIFWTRAVFPNGLGICSTQRSSALNHRQNWVATRLQAGSILIYQIYLLGFVRRVLAVQIFLSCFCDYYIYEAKGFGISIKISVLPSPVKYYPEKKKNEYICSIGAHLALIFIVHYLFLNQILDNIFWSSFYWSFPTHTFIASIQPFFSALSNNRLRDTKYSSDSSYVDSWDSSAQ